MDRPRFEAAVRSAKEYIRQGDAFQVVISQRLATSFGGRPFDVHRAQADQPVAIPLLCEPSRGGRRRIIP